MDKETKTRESVTACVVTFNEEKNIGRCLDSVAWCDEIVVVDSFSTDRTVEIARQYTDKVVQREWPGFRAQKEFAREQGSCEWSLLLDADEEISPELKAEIFQALENSDAVGYSMPRMVFYLGKWIRHGDWYPDRKLRLYKKDCGHIDGIDPHDFVQVDGAVEKLGHPIFHYTYDDPAHHMRTLDQFTTVAAKEKFKMGRTCSVNDLAFRPIWAFLRGYFFKAGFLDGKAGLVVAVMGAFGVWTKYMKLYDLNLKNRASG
jgi:glycosyltransferase involved in cell wall biosynthesis